MTLPSGLKEIGQWAFNGCTSLKNVISYNQNAPTLGADAFKNVSIKNLTILNGSLNSYKTNWNIDENITNIIYLYKITVETNDENMGSAFVSEKIALQDTLINLTAIPNNEYRFVKLESTDVNESMGQFNMPNSNVTIKAIFEIDNYNIVFNSNSGTAVESKQVLNGNKLIKPTDPTKENFVFDGWYIDEEFNEQFDFNTPITKDITLYAKWRNEENFTYTFISGDNQKLTLGDIKSYILKIDGDYSLFESLIIGNLELIKDEDYEVTEGSTVITFTNKGITKLNTLPNGEYEIIVNYSNSNQVTGKLIINKNEYNPNTSDKIVSYLIIGSISLISLFGCSLYLKRKKFN